MTREKQIQKYESKQLIDELSKMSPMVIATAHLHATLYGEDVTVVWGRCYGKRCYRCMGKMLRESEGMRNDKKGKRKGDRIF